MSFFADFIRRYQDTEDVVIIYTQPIKWGGTGLLHSMLDLLKLAYSNQDNTYFHMLTGQDILIKPLQDLYLFFDKYPDSNFIEYGDDFMKFAQTSILAGINRSQYYHLFDYLNYRGNKIHRQIEKYFVKTQQLFRMKRKWPFPNYYQGSGWFSLNRAAVDEILKFMQKNHRIAEDTFAPDEVIFQSILLNSNTNFNVVNDNLRYIIWDNQGEVGSPAILTERHFEDMVASHCFFARKIHPEKSKQLIEMIHNHIKKNTL